MKKKNKRERYSIIISSLTDARKKPFVFSIAKTKLIFGICAVFVIVTVSSVAAVLTSSQAVSTSAEAEVLEARSDDQAELISSYSAQLIQLKQYRYMNGIDSKGIKAINKAAAAEGQTTAQQQAPPLSQDKEALQGSLLSLSPGKSAGAKSIDKAAVKSIPMTEAIEQINADFQAVIDRNIEEIKANEGFAEADVIYNEGEDGDSNIENNWADVLSVYSVITMHDKLRFMTITLENQKLLKKVYNEMNQVSFYTKTTPYTAEDETVSAYESIKKIKFTICVSVNSLTYTEGAKLHKFSKKQKQKLKQLMSPSYYTYFADVLGLDVYDGMKSEDLQAIISRLPEGSKGSEIVKTALIRLGHPYSGSKRGRGNYVDCSYLVYWVYNQAGIKLPTTSVLQAIYCYNKGYLIGKKDLKPGDLIFWSQKGNDRWKGIHHVAIYIGSGKTIEASSKRGRVVIRKLWSGSEWRIAFYARPYKEKKAAAALPTFTEGLNGEEKES